MKYIDTLLIFLWCSIAIKILLTTGHTGTFEIIMSISTILCGIDIGCKYFRNYKD